MFKLPPVDKRKSFHPLIKRLFLHPKMDELHDDAFIYYLSSKAAIFIGVVLSLFNFLSYIFQVNFHFIFFDVGISKDNFVREYIRSFPVYFTLIMAIPLNIFFSIVLKKNVECNAYDFLWWGEKSKSMSPRKTIVVHVIGYLFIFSLMIFSGALASLVADRLHLYDSVWFFVFLLVFYPALLVHCNLALISSPFIIIRARKLSFSIDSLR